ncbi:GNAT family N-acetyltransferase [Gallaecimonas xiamenensis]
MTIRQLEERDLEAASAVCMAAFLGSVAATLAAEGLETFKTIAAPGAFRSRMQQDNLILVAEHQGQVAGLIELKEGRHLAMLFIAPQWQQKGLGRQLLAAVLPHARGDEVTVRASLSSVPAYQKYGFVCQGEVGQVAGLVFQPMVLALHSVSQSQVVPAS